MKAKIRSRASRHSKRRSSPPRGRRIVLRPGQRLVTATVIVTARRGGGGGAGVTTTVTCECTKAEPDTPDCKPVTTKSDHTITVKCNKTGGCKTCKQTTTTSGIVMA